MKRILPFTKEHEMFREAFGNFLDKEAVPYYDEWLKNHQIDHSFYEKMGQHGYMAMWLEPEYGGPGGDFLYTVVKAEEYSKRGLNCIMDRLSGDVTAPYIYQHGTEAQKKEWLPKIAKGEVMMAICMSEPNAGSDLAALQTRADKDGDDYIINGNKIWMTNGMISDLLLVAVRTDQEVRPLHRGVSLILVPANTPGVTRRYIPRIGLQAQDTAEIFFDNVRVPKANLLGEENKGFKLLMQHLESERLLASYGAITCAQHSLEITKEYVKKRELFGKKLADFQNTQFKLVEMEAEYRMAQNYLDLVLVAYMNGEPDLNTDAALVKYYCSDLSFRIADKCVQLFGGIGICEESHIARNFVDSRIHRFMGGTTETLMNVAARGIGLR